MAKGPLCCFNDVLWSVLLLAGIAAGFFISVVIFRFTVVTAYNASDPAHFWHSSVMSDFDNTTYWVESFVVALVFWGVLAVGACLIHTCSAGTACTGSCLWCLTKHGYNRYMEGRGGDDDLRADYASADGGGVLDPYSSTAGGGDLPGLELRGTGREYEMGPMSRFGTAGPRDDDSFVV